MSTKNAAVLDLLGRLQVAVVIADVETGEILWVNGAHAHLSGAQSPDKVLGHNIFEFLGPEQLAAAMQGLEAVATGESPAPVVYHVRRLDGATADVHISSTPVSFGRRPAMLSIVTDVTESERRAAALEETESRYRAVADASPNGIVVSIRDSIVYANEAMASLLGATSGQALVGTDVARYATPETRARLRQARSEASAGGRPRSDEIPVELIRADGTQVATSAVVATISWEGEDASLSSFCTSRGDH